LISIDHGISRREIQERLDEQKLHLDRDYIGKLFDEIMAERARRMDRKAMLARVRRRTFAPLSAGKR
jgi:hypothetical protein